MCRSAAGWYARARTLPGPRLRLRPEDPAPPRLRPEDPGPAGGAAPAVARLASVVDGGAVGAPAPAPARLDAVAAFRNLSPAPARLDAVAVAAFRNLSPAPADAWLAEGIAETLTTAFMGLDGMSVVAAAAGGATPAAWSVEGEYRRRDALLRIDARLVDTRSGFVVARSSAEGPAADIFDLQDRIAADLSAALENPGTMPAASPRPPQAGPSASSRAAAITAFRAARHAAAERIDGFTGLGN